MKIKIKNREGKTIYMQTSMINGLYSICLHDIGKKREDAEHWGYLDKNQQRRMLREINNELYKGY